MTYLYKSTRYAEEECTPPRVYKCDIILHERIAMKVASFKMMSPDKTSERNIALRYEDCVGVQEMTILDADARALEVLKNNTDRIIELTGTYFSSDKKSYFLLDSIAAADAFTPSAHNIIEAEERCPEPVRLMAHHIWGQAVLDGISDGTRNFSLRCRVNNFTAIPSDFPDMHCLNLSITIFSEYYEPSINTILKSVYMYPETEDKLLCRQECIQILHCCEFISSDEDDTVFLDALENVYVLSDEKDISPAYLYNREFVNNAKLLNENSIPYHSVGGTVAFNICNAMYIEPANMDLLPTLLPEGKYACIQAEPTLSQNDIHTILEEPVLPPAKLIVYGFTPLQLYTAFPSVCDLHLQGQFFTDEYHRYPPVFLCEVVASYDMSSSSSSLPNPTMINSES